MRIEDTFEDFFNAAEVLPISQDVIERSVRLQQIRIMSLGDAIIAGTALFYNLTLITRNVDDFRWIPELRLLNPFEINHSD